MRRTTYAVLVAALLALGASPRMAHAVFDTLAICDILAGTVRQQGPGNVACAGSLGPPTTVFGTVQTAAEASASYGLLHAAAESTWSPTPQVFPSTGSFARWRDDLTLAAAGESGAGSLRFDFFLEGFLDVTGSGFASVELHISNSFGNQGGQGGAFFSTILNGPGAIGLVDDFSLPFTWGVPFELSATLSVTLGEIGCCSTGFAQGLFLNTAGWGGIIEVLDEFGNVVPNYTVTSSSGTDWRFSQRPAQCGVPGAPPCSVPEPATFLLFGSGLAGLASWVQRRRAKR